MNLFDDWRPEVKEQIAKERAEFDQLFEHTFRVSDRELLAALNNGDKLILSINLPETRYAVKCVHVLVKSVDLDRKLITVIEDRS